MIGSLNHLTLATLDLDVSFSFYRNLMGFKPLARWGRGAYLLAGETTWICLSIVARRSRALADDYTHYAFSVAAERFDSVAASFRAHGVVEWKRNTSEGQSLYILDPDGHKLELHVGDWADRLRACRGAPYEGMEFF